MSDSVIKRLLRPYKRPVMRVAERVAYYAQLIGPSTQMTSNGVARRRPRILICDENEPAYDLHAGGTRMHEIIKILANRAEVWFTPLRPHDDPKYQREISASGVRMLPLWRLRYGLRSLDF